MCRLVLPAVRSGLGFQEEVVYGCLSQVTGERHFQKMRLGQWSLCPLASLPERAHGRLQCQKDMRQAPTSRSRDALSHCSCCKRARRCHFDTLKERGTWFCASLRASCVLSLGLSLTRKKIPRGWRLRGLHGAGGWAGVPSLQPPSAATWICARQWHQRWPSENGARANGAPLRLHFAKHCHR